MGHALLCFPCCMEERPQPYQRPRIDRSMIGLPQDFRHTAHIGNRDLNAVGRESTIEAIQNQMSSKGGYQHVSPVDVQLNVIDLPTKLNGTHESERL